jgi:hypothetical protein
MRNRPPELMNFFLISGGTSARPGLEAVLQALKAGHEVAVDLSLQQGQRSHSLIAVGLAELGDETADVLGGAGQLALNVAGRRFAAGEGEAPLEGVERGDQPVEVQRDHGTEADRGHDRREIGDHFPLLGLLVRDQQQCRVHLGHGLEPAEGRLLGA